MEDRKSEVKQREVPSNCKTKINNSIGCVNQRLRDFLQGHKTGEPWSKL